MLTYSPSISPGISPCPEIADMYRLDLPGLRASVAGPESLLAPLRLLFPPAAYRPSPPGDEALPTRFAIAVEPTNPWRFRVAQDAQIRWENLRQEELPALLEWAIVTAAVERFGKERLLFHAGAVALHGRGMILPARSGSGKSTLTAALIAAGFRLGSDEVGMVDLATMHLLPFFKSVCVKAGSRIALATCAPELLATAPVHPRNNDLAWYATPPPAAWLDAPVPVRFVVFPHYSSDARAALTPLPRATALLHLLELSFSAGQLGSAGVACAVELVREATCYTLTVGNLAEAVSLLRACYE